MHRRDIFALASGTALAAAAAPARRDLAELLRPTLAQYGLPAIAAACVRGGKIVAAGAIGTRRIGTNNPVALTDAFHIGSDGKAITALLAAMLVEQGALSWTSTVAEILPDLAGAMDPGCRNVTLTQLLSHTGGLPPDDQAMIDLVMQDYAQEGNLDVMRAWLVGRFGRRKLATKPGSAFAYSNMGYVTAGAMIERVGHSTWEEMVATRIFDPLRLRTAGFGPPARLGRVDAPLGHVAGPDGKLQPRLAGPNGDNPPMLGPAGTAHLSILDFATWAAWNAAEGRRGPALVRPETLRHLHTAVIDMVIPNPPPGTPASGSYGLGWGIVKPSYTPDPVLTHSGSNGANLATIVVQPKRDIALVMATNIGGSEADAALRALTPVLWRIAVA